MTSREDVQPVFEKALQVMESKEDVYGDAWRTCGESVCVSEVFRKANYIRVQRRNDRYTPDKLVEDLLDLINWSAFSIYLLEEEISK